MTTMASTIHHQHDSNDSHLVQFKLHSLKVPDSPRRKTFTLPGVNVLLVLPLKPKETNWRQSHKHWLTTTCRALCPVPDLMSELGPLIPCKMTIKSATSHFRLAMQSGNNPHSCNKQLCHCYCSILVPFQWPDAGPAAKNFCSRHF